MLSLYFNNVRIPDWVKVVDIKEDILPSLETTKYKTQFNEKTITIDYIFRRNKLIDETKRREFIAWLRGDDFNNSKLVLPSRPNFYYLAKVSNASEINGSIRKGQGSIVFTCYQSENISLNNTKVILTNIDKNKTIQYEGTAPTYPKIIFRVKRALSKIKLNFSNSKMNSFLEINGSFNAGDIIEFNQETNKLTRNNRNILETLHLNSRRSKLIQGSNQYILEASEELECEINYNEKFI